jgi:hypothetical protein
MRTCKQELDGERRQRIHDAIQALKVFGSGGAATSSECIEWTNQLGIPLVLDIGMTELGGEENDFQMSFTKLIRSLIGPLFHSTPSGMEGWHRKDCLLADASLRLIDEAGVDATSGKLFSDMAPTFLFDI